VIMIHSSTTHTTQKVAWSLESSRLSTWRLESFQLRAAHSEYVGTCRLKYVQ